MADEEVEEDDGRSTGFISGEEPIDEFEVDFEDDPEAFEFDFGEEDDKA